MHVSAELFTVRKRFPLTISRGTTAQTTNVWVKVAQDGIEGWGEASPFSLGDRPQSTETLLEAIQTIAPQLQSMNPWERQRIGDIIQTMPSSAQAAIDMALHDWIGKKAGLPLWQLWGLDCDRIVPTSVTIGINTPEAALARVRDWLQFIEVKIFKIKLGNPAGIEADREMLAAIRDEVPTLELFVDANGGWNLDDAIAMCRWLADYDVKYVEQPLARGEEKHLPQLKQRSPLPIFVDESCMTSRDIPQLSNCVRGINIKLMKAGGLSEAMRMVQVAKALGLQVMFGCYSDSSLSNTAAAHLAPLADYLDLDSHLNLTAEPFVGAIIRSGRLLPNCKPGLGVERSAVAG
ncbi:MAG: L-Ala-D/L-Glu epimerase [Chroococcidiopsis cubana SAG 39.79]|uniref:dipeptide epimerase n=1 Tax=Chroococcidiopsis cubana TaxID=171392 RepID=UPI000D0847DB|nr:dipeptide epimerase [Chroococcidiopsis cubana]MDZ4872433.1 L-Ala-D/L-Glu epimerase [Chroococcidiopsis cubana SAG 39.79]PSB65548.1 dipeptide epimerase [Chroococcidiopsis cubana CCALA 043]